MLGVFCSECLFKSWWTSAPVSLLHAFRICPDCFWSTPLAARKPTTARLIGAQHVIKVKAKLIVGNAHASILKWSAAAGANRWQHLYEHYGFVMFCLPIWTYGCQIRLIKKKIHQPELVRKKSWDVKPQAMHQFSGRSKPWFFEARVSLAVPCVSVKIASSWVFAPKTPEANQTHLGSFCPHPYFNVLKRMQRNDLFLPRGPMEETTNRPNWSQVGTPCQSSARQSTDACACRWASPVGTMKIAAWNEEHLEIYIANFELCWMLLLLQV